MEKINLPAYQPASLKKKTKIGRWYRPLVLSYLGEEKVNEPIKYTISSKDIPFHLIRSDAKDLLFIDAAGQIIPYWIESMSSDKIDVFLKFSKLSKSLVPFWVYYGNKVNQGISHISAAFKYRRKITITEQSGNDLSDYQVRIDLDATNFDFSHFLNGGEDLAFTDTEGNPLSYWVEKMDISAQEATIWVKVPSIPANSSVDIYMYYGSSEVESASTPQAMEFVCFERDVPILGRIEFSDYTCIKPAVLGGKRWLVLSKGWLNSEYPVEVWEVESDWKTPIATYTGWDMADTYAYTLPSLYPDKIFILGRGRGGQGVTSYFDINSKTFEIIKEEYHENYHIGLLYNEATNEIYIVPATNVNYFYKTNPENFLTGNWEQVTIPGDTYTENNLAIFKEKVYVLKFMSVTYEWELLSWDPQTDVWTTIMTNPDSTSTAVNTMPHLRANDEMITAALCKQPPKRFEIWYSEDGENWVHAFDVPFIYEANELQCYAFPFNGDILVQQTNWEADGYITLFSKTGEILEHIAPVMSHCSPHNDLIHDEELGYFLLSGEGNGGISDVKIFPEQRPWRCWLAPIKSVEYRTPAIEGNYEFHWLTGRSDGRFYNANSNMIAKNFALVCKLRTNYDDDSGIGFRCAGGGHYVGAITGYYIMVPRSDDTNLYIRRVDDGSWTVLDSVSLSASTSEVYTITVKAINNTFKITVERSDLGVVYSNTITDDTYSEGVINALAPGWDANKNPSFDSIIVRKFTEPEPSVSVGDEEII